MRILAFACIVTLPLWMTTGGSAQPLPVGPGPASAKLTIEERWQLDETSSGELLGPVGGMVELPSGEVWATVSRLEPAIVAIDPETLSVRPIAPRFAGHAQLRSPTLMARTPDLDVAVLDVSKSTVEVFDNSGRWLRRVALNRPVFSPKGLLVLKDGSVVISGGSQRDDYALHVFEPSGKRVEAWVATPQTSTAFSNYREAEVHTVGGPFVSWNEGLVLSLSAPQRILFLQRGDAEPRSVMAENHLGLEPAASAFVSTTTGASELTSFNWFYPQTRGLFLLSESKFLNVVTFHDADESVWQVFDHTGQLLAQTSADRAYWPWTLTENGDILASVFTDRNAGTSAIVRLRVSFVE